MINFQLLYPLTTEKLGLLGVCLFYEILEYSDLSESPS
jgi:hypothetical protein